MNRTTIALVLALTAGPHTLAAQWVEPDPWPALRVQAFSVPTEQFFAGSAQRYTFYGCTGLFESRLCLTSLLETGIEGVTGRGALRSTISRVAGNVRRDDRGPGWALYSGGQITGRLAGHETSWWVQPPRIGESVLRSSVTGGPQFDTFQPDSWQQYQEVLIQYVHPCDHVCGNVYYLEGRLVSTETLRSTATLAPEPGTWALLGTGLLGLGAVARRRRAM